ncbi:centrosomal protein of 290 kDa-like [Pituophis catenifer annectens]|uniref:centrosomal protein of 290 kDa-like n=1 Tax=Pituophis catenifer annectens TaxID=94852 RepID=UPI003992AEBE
MASDSSFSVYFGSPRLRRASQLFGAVAGFEAELRAPSVTGLNSRQFIERSDDNCFQLFGAVAAFEEEPRASIVSCAGRHFEFQRNVPSSLDKRNFIVSSDLNSLLHVPSVDAPVAALLSSSSIPGDPEEGLRPEERRSEQVLQRAHLGAAWAIKSATTISFFNPKSLASSIAAHRLVWLCYWQADARHKWCLVSVPFLGKKLFGDHLDKFLMETKDKRKILPAVFCRGEPRFSPYVPCPQFRSLEDGLAIEFVSTPPLFFVRCPLSQVAERLRAIYLALRAFRQLVAGAHVLAEAVDALCSPWPQGLLYAFLPIPLIPRVSRRPENIRMQLDQDLNLRMRSHQIVHTKTERLEVDLKRARNQSYAKTMEMSKLLTEKEELELKIQELTNKNLQLAKEKEELFILCKEYEEKLSREKSSDEPGQLDKLRRENESLSCKLKKYAGENAELLRENNDLKEEFYRKRGVIAKLTIENKELEMKTEVLTFKNIELTDEKEELCREYEIRLWRETQLRKGRCPLMMDRDQMEQRPSSRESKGGSVSRRPENIRMQLDQDLNLRMRSHQIVHTKTERLEVDLKRARNQSYAKTMEMSKLLTEKEELELKIQELTNKNLQLAKEKEELFILCKEYEEKLSREKSSDEPGQLDKLRRENESLSCKLKKYAGENAELLRENNDLKEEFYRKRGVIAKLTIENKELEMKTEVLTFKNIELTDEKEELCREYEIRLWRETQLRKGRCPLMMDRDQMEQRPSSRESKGGSVSRRPENIRMQLDQDLNLRMRSHQIVHTKTERLEVDLKRARNQSYAKTMEMSKLLTEKEELELKIQELTNKNLQLAKEKEELFILCKEYEEKLSREKSSDEPGQLDKLRRENESLSCKLKKYAGENAELLRENNDLKEEFYRKRGVIAKLTIENKELEMKTEVLTFKNIELTDEKEELCREYEIRLWRETQLRKGRCPLMMDRDQMEQRPSSRESKGGSVSRRPENIRMQLDQDLNLRMRSHQIVHTKTERLEVDLKRARNQSYAKTMEMSKLLTEKEELELKIQELTNKNLQLAKEKEELFILCKEYEEKLSREKSSDEPGQLDKLRRENESLSCKLKKYAGENAELLRENNDLKEEFYRKRGVIAKLTIENKELEMKTEVLTFKNIELTDEKEELCREYEIRLWRETQLRKGRCPLMMDRDQMEQRPSSRESKGGSVSRRPENIRMQLDQDLNLRMRSHQIVHTKTERLEVDLKRARNQSYAKTMEMSKLLTEKEELELKIQELTNKNLQLAKEKEELFILCKEYEEKLSREKSSDEPGQLDKLRRENESLSCKLKKYAGENAELLRENNDLKEEFYRKRGVIAKLTIENKELEMKTEVLTFKNIELTDEKEELCREYEIRLWRETQLRKGRCPLMMDRDQMEQRPSSRESKGGSVSRRPENIRMQLDQDLNLRMRSHQIVHTKTERLEVDLKRARNQSYAKTMEMSKLLTEKEELELKIQELTNKNLQLAKEKEELFILCKEYEEKLSREKSSDEPGQLDKLRRENESLSCKLKKYAGENAELLRENNDLKEEFYRKRGVIAKLTIENKELEMKTEVLTFKNIELTDEKEELCREYEIRLWRETQLRKGRCPLMMDRDQMEQRPSSRESKGGSVSRRPENIRMQLDQDLNLRMRSHQIVHTKTERLEVDLKRARNQSYAKTMEMSKLLTEKEELELKIQELTNKNLQLAKEKEELFILCKEYEEKLSREKSSDEPGQLDKLRRENESLSCKLKKYAGENAELLRENNDLKEEFYRKRGVIAKLTIENKELEMKTEVLTFKNIELTDEKEELCREYEIRLWRETQLRKGRCPLMMDRDQMEQRPSSRESKGGSVSRRPENIRMQLDQDLNLRMRSHQIVHTKTERLEVDLKRARNQSYAKTMEMSKLLTEKEELELKIQELTNKNLQLAKEKEELFILCKEYEEKLSREKSSDEPGQLDKLRRENESLSCKLKKYAGENAELLRENNDLKEEFYRKRGVIAKLTIENKELEMKTEVLTFKNIELTDEKEELCREYEIRLWRETQLRKGRCPLMMDRDQMEQRPSSRESKGGSVSRRPENIRMQLDQDLNLRMRSHQIVHTKTERLEVDLKRARNQSYAKTMEMSKLLTEKEELELKIQELTNKNLQLAKEKEELFILCKEYEEKLSREKSSDEPGQLDKLRRENESLSCKLKKYAGENAELLRENNDLKEEFYRKRGVIAKLTIENKELEMKTEVLTFKNIELTDEKEELCREYEIRLWRETQLRKGRCPLMMDRDQMEQRPSSRESKGGSVSRRPENIRMQLDQDLNLRMRSHQIVHTKTERLEVDLKRARNQSYAKTMEMSKLLTEKEELELKIQELTNKNLQLAKEKEELFILCKEYEEKLSREKSSDEPGQLDKLRRENESLSCKLKKYAGENAELLRENNDLKEEFYRKRGVIAKLTIENKELEMKTEVLTFKNIELTDEKEELCREYEIRLWRETQLRKGRCPLMMDRDQMEQRPSSRESKGGSVSRRPENIRMQLDQDLNLRMRSHQIVHTKTERLEVDLKRARNQSYAKTMEMSKLLTEKEELELKIQELTNKNLQLAKEKEELFILCKEYEEKLSREKSSDEPGQLDKLRRENESLSCKLKKYAGENAELLRENNDLKEEFYRKRGVIAKLTIENKELEMKTEVLTFKNIELTDEKEELCREYEIRLWRETQLRKGRCPLMMDRDQMEQRPSSRESKGGSVSRRPENIRMQLDQDLNLRMRSHQIVHTKTERLEVDLKRARNQSYAKTMEMSKLLTEKEELELKIQELTNKNLQLAKEKEELFILCKEYEEKLSREKSSDEPGQLDKLRRENESLSCKLKKYAGENAELLRENNDLKEEFYRKRGVIAKLTIENKELEMKTEVLTFKNIELTDEKEELCREYEIRLWRETQLRKGRCPLMMDRDQMEQRPSSRESKGGSVSRRPENIRMQLDQDLNLRMRSHQIVHTKTERLEVDLKRARNQSYAKTMEMSKLLTEKEELELKIQELTNKNLQLAKEKEELFILCKEYEEKLSREKSSDEPGKLDKLRRENESLSCKLKKYAGENAELLRENNDLKEEFYRKRGVIAKLTIENKELEMKTEVLTFKNIELTDEKEELCREYEIRLWRETQLRKGRCPLMMDRDQMEQRPSSRESKGGSVSRRPENIRMQLDQDLNLRMCSHQIVHTKTERLEVDLKRARNQSYAKTMEMSKLLTEKEELELKIQELTNKNLQLAKEKEELFILCKEYEEKLSREKSSDEPGKLDKLRRENESLSCKLKKYAGENAELLRENNDLKEEFYRKRGVIAKLTIENKELEMKTEVLTFKNIELTDEKEELCREYEKRLWRETQLRKGRCPLMMDRDPMEQRPSSRESKGGSVSLCQTRADITENKTEAQDKTKPQINLRYQLNKKWLKASVDSLKIRTSKEPGQNILRWLQQSLKILKEDSSELYTLPEWLKASTTNLPKECAEASRGDVNGWLETSINHLQEEGPETCDLDVQGWLEASIIGIQHLQKSKSSQKKGMAGKINREPQEAMS